MTPPSSLAGINQLSAAERDRLYATFIPLVLWDRFHINPATFSDEGGSRLLTVTAEMAGSVVEVDLRHSVGAQDPLLYAQLTDTLNGQIHVMLYVVNDPTSPRFETDRTPEGSRTQFGTLGRNLPAEEAALAAGLAPGQVRRGLRILSHSILAFEAFVSLLGRDLFFAEPLSYHNAVVFERYGFAYQQGRRWMESIDTRFRKDGDLLRRLDGSNAFRQPQASQTILGRSWAIHDGILGEPFSGVHMYKVLGKQAGVNTFRDGMWKD
ncbi:MAG: hypothetical protein ABSG98_09460 [Anaerolineales bacterium]|jgi:hypothetical protein